VELVGSNEANGSWINFKGIIVYPDKAVSRVEKKNAVEIVEMFFPYTGIPIQVIAERSIIDTVHFSIPEETEMKR